jgi:hypothetical protein
MQAIEPTTIILTTYFRPRNQCSICHAEDARTACGSRYCVTCWESINDELISQAGEWAE